MKILIFTDNHFCESSSIVRQFGTKYSIRLENQIASLDWVEKTAKEKGCKAVICAGDFFDKPTLTDSELTALRDISWNDLPHYFLVGNHESSVNGLTFSSTKALEAPDRHVVAEPTTLRIGEAEICFLPYVIESDRKPVGEYFGERSGKRVIISHNDLLGLQMGPIASKTGFAMTDLESNADLIVNGHLHNGQKVSDKIINLGNLTGQNFSEDAEKYRHNVMILDLTTLKYELIENPYAINFYKIDVKNDHDLDKLKNLNGASAVSVSCVESLIKECKDVISNLANAIASRVIVVSEASRDGASGEIDFSVDYISKFVDCAKKIYGDGRILNEELAEICK